MGSGTGSTLSSMGNLFPLRRKQSQTPDIERGKPLSKIAPAYQCQDKDCGRIVSEDIRLRITIPWDKGRVVYKCPYCRGSLKEIDNKKEK